MLCRKSDGNRRVAPSTSRDRRITGVEEPGPHVMSGVRLLSVVGTVFLSFPGCSHDVAFQPDASWAYRIDVEKIDTSVLVVIDRATLDQKYSVQTFAAGPENIWEIGPGQMLNQVALAETPNTNNAATERLVLSLALENYTFDAGVASVVMRTRASTKSGHVLIGKSYLRQGSRNARKEMGGQWTMKSVMRQSSLEAFKGVFADMRADLVAALRP
jgi:hypothetical protein